MKKEILTLFILFLVSGLYAQDDYYWYNGGQIFVDVFPYKKVLEVDRTIINSVELEGVLNNPNISVVDFKDLAFLDYMNHIYDSTFFDKQYAVIESEDSISEEAINHTAIKYIGPFIDPPIGDLMGVSNIFLVVLNSAEDFNVLDSLAAEYHLIIIGDSNIEPDRLFYLYCSDDTGMNGLEMANIFYELGVFQDSEGYYIFDANPLGLFDIKKTEIEASISVYPNPADDFVYITTDLPQHETFIFNILDINGKIVKHGVIDDKHKKISIANIKSGRYIIKLITSKGEINCKSFVKL